MSGKARTAESPLPSKRGRPTSYHKAFDEQLEGHLAQGFTIDSFAAVVGVHRDTIYAWAKEHPEFAAAKLRGEGRREAFLIKMGQALATGSLTYVKTEEPVLHNGKPVYDNHGSVIIKRTYAQSKGSAAAWIFMCKNMLGWNDCRQMQIATPSLEPEMSHEERLAEIRRLQKVLLICGND